MRSWRPRISTARLARSLTGSRGAGILAAFLLGLLSDLAGQRPAGAEKLGHQPRPRSQDLTRQDAQLLLPAGHLADPLDLRGGEPERGRLDLDTGRGELRENVDLRVL